MIPVKDTRELLYKLFKVEFVQLQEVARTADHSPSRTFYLWRVRGVGLQPSTVAHPPAAAHQVDLLRVIDKICSELYRTISKVRARLRHEWQQEQELLARLAAASAGAASEGAAGPALTSEQQSRKQRLRRVVSALEGSLMRLDRLRLLFCDM